MTGTNASIEVEGSAAANIARELLNALGIPPSDIGEADLKMVVNGDGETEVVFAADGPRAGDITADMIGGVEWADFEVHSIDAAVAEREEPALPAGDDEEATTQPTVGVYQPQVTPLVGKVDPEYVEFPGEDPGRIRENTQLHVIGKALMDWYEDHDEAWVGTIPLAEYESNPLTENQTQSAASRLFRHKGLTVRRQQSHAQGRKYEYHPTKQLAEEIERLGEYATESVDGAVDAGEEPVSVGE